MNDSVALVLILSGVLVFYMCIVFVKSLAEKLMKWGRRGRSRFTPEENAAYYRGLHRGRQEGMAGYLPWHQADMTPRYPSGRPVRYMAPPPQLEVLDENDDADPRYIPREDPRYIEADRTPRLLLPRRKAPRHEERQ